ncbi:hypothetical protein IMG5_046420, partial [Ichthyophthirius multifiliis]
MFNKLIFIYLLILVILTESNQQQNNGVVNASSECQVGYYYVQDTHQCASCQTKFSNCLQCTQSSCSQCATGYFQHDSDTQCNRDTSFLDKYTGDYCNEGCNTCLESRKCIECKDGYYLNIDQQGETTCVSCSTKFDGCQR